MKKFLVKNAAGLAEQVLKTTGPLQMILQKNSRKRRLKSRDSSQLSATLYNLIANYYLYKRAVENFSAATGITMKKNDVTGYMAAIAALCSGFSPEWPSHADKSAAYIPDIDSVTTDEDKAVFYSLPLTLYRRLNLLCDNLELTDRHSFFTVLKKKGPVTLRVNRLKTAPRQLRQKVEAEGFLLEKTRYMPGAFHLTERENLQHSSAFRNGEFELQDEGSQIAGALCAVQENEVVLDLCAGAGGKTLQLASECLNRADIFATDIDDTRLARLRPRAAKAGAMIQTVPLDNINDSFLKQFKNKTDVVLIDAPCSGTGIIRRKPEIALRFSEERLKELTGIQYDLLKKAAGLLKTGGRIVYVTCSLLPDENENLIERFLNENEEFSQLNAYEILQQRGVSLSGDTFFLRLIPSEHGTDGFTAAVLQKD